LETIASLRPTLIVAQRVQAVLADELAAIAPVELLSWLTLDEVIASTRSLGRITGCEVAASALADELKARLTRVPPEDSPRVLLAFGSTPGRRGMVSFFRRNSLYGAALAAAGGRNVVDEDIWGVPTMSLEHVIALNPQIVIILIQTDQPDADEDRRYIADWLLLPITASKRGAIRIVRDSAVNTVGPRILRLVDKIAASIQDATKNLQ
jgi:ABC-type Fe3+-hydroxamate transport system substrate-binding protein